MKNLFFFIISILLIGTTSCEREDESKLEVDKPKLEFTADGGKQELTVTSNGTWEIKIDDKSWLTASLVQGEGNETIEFTALAFESVGEPRHNNITVTDGFIERTVEVSQSPAGATLDVDKPELSYNYEGGNDLVTITSNTTWEIIIKEEDKWITSDHLSGTGNGEVMLTIAQHNGDSNRSATVKVTYGTEEKEIKISQTFPKMVGLWILSEGDALKTNAALGYYDFVSDQLRTKVYNEENGEILGQVANFMGLYGSKLYIVMSGPAEGTNSSVKVLNSKTGKLIKNIPMKSSHGEGDVSRQIAFHDGKAYVTSYLSGGKGEPGSSYTYYGGVVRIDTATLNIEASLRVGDKPEGIIYHENRLFVCNSSTGLGTTISVIDVNTFSQTNLITVPQNPTYIKTAPNGDIYFSTLETFYGTVKPSAIHKLDPQTYNVTTYDNFRATRFGISDGYIYSGELNWNTFEDTINRLDRQTGVVSNVDIDHSYFMVYSFDVNPITGDIYIGSVGDTVIIMNNEGVKMKTLKMKAPYVNQFIPIFE